MHLSAIFLLSSIAQTALSSKAAFDQFQGNWRCVVATTEGKPLEIDVSKVRLNVAGVDWNHRLGEQRINWRLHKIEAAKSPKRLEFRDHPLELTQGLSRIPGRYYCVYEMRDDSLKMCISLDPADGFPKKIVSDSSKCLYFEWRRVKDK